MDEMKEAFAEDAFKNFIQGLQEEGIHFMGHIRCFHCGGQVCWDNDFSYEDMGYEGEGIVHICHCSQCGAEIEYRVPDKEEEE